MEQTTGIYNFDIMKSLYVIVSVLACAFAFSTIDHEWEDFKVKFNKIYSVEEDARRHQIFLQNKIFIAEHNKKFENGESTFTMGINKFADMLPGETSYLKGYKQSPKSLQGASQFEPEEGVSYPDTVDWREKGYVTPVKNQEQCGSSYAFSATGSLEGQNFAKTGELVSLSEQNIVDCDHNDLGCFGGYMINVYKYVKFNGGIDTEESYPYYGFQSHCGYNSNNIGGTCSGYKVVTGGNEDKLQAAVATIGPISVAIDASNNSFNLYQGGIYYEEYCHVIPLDHAALVVGYGTLNGTDYWLVKNSWGEDWGEKGYIKMSRNRDNNCGIASEATYPLV